MSTSFIIGICILDGMRASRVDFTTTVASAFLLVLFLSEAFTAGDNEVLVSTECVFIRGGAVFRKVSVVRKTIVDKFNFVGVDALEGNVFL